MSTGEDACYFPTTPSVFILLVGARLVNVRISILIAALIVMYVGPTTHPVHHPLSPHLILSAARLKQDSPTLGTITPH